MVKQYGTFMPPWYVTIPFIWLFEDEIYPALTDRTIVSTDRNDVPIPKHVRQDDRQQ